MLDTADLTFGVDVEISATAFCDRIAEEPLTKAERRRARAVAGIVNQLPESGSVVIVHSPTVVGGWRKLILELRGATVAASAKVLVAPVLRDERAVTAGLDVPVFRDPFVDESREHRRAIAQAWRL